MINDPDNTTPDWHVYFARFAPRLILFARQWLPEVTDAEDAVQEAFVRFWRKHQTPADDHAGLLFASVRSAALDHIRRDARRKRRELIASDEHYSFAAGREHLPLFDSVAADTALPVETALQRLPAEQREVLVLKIWGELTFAQIAEALGLSPNTAASRYRYAITALKKVLHPIYHE